MVSLASGAEVRFAPPPLPEKYSTLDAGRFCRYKWAYPVHNSLCLMPMSQLLCEEVALSILGGDFECILDRVSLCS
jgi:hypothetical protein